MKQITVDLQIVFKEKLLNLFLVLYILGNLFAMSYYFYSISSFETERGFILDFSVLLLWILVFASSFNFHKLCRKEKEKESEVQFKTEPLSVESLPRRSPRLNK